MMPHSTKPKITQADITSGYVTRRFVKHVSRHTVVEVSEAQYNIFTGNVYYQRLSFQWVIGRTDIDIPTVGNQMILGAKSQNEILTAYYDKQMSGLSRILRNPLEFFSGKKVTLSTPYTQRIPIAQETTTAATALTVSVSSISLSYIIGSAPVGEEILIDADGVVTGLTATTPSPCISLLLSSTTTPATLTITPELGGQGAGVCNGVVTITGIGIEPILIDTTRTAEYNPIVLFGYTAGDSLASATFTRNSIATYNEVV